MTEREWLASNDPETMLLFLREKASDRKLRLFACACCRRIDHLLDPYSQSAIDVFERHIEGLAGEVTMTLTSILHDESFEKAKPYTASHIATMIVNAVRAEAAWAAAWNVVGEARRAIRYSRQGDTIAEAKAQAALFRDVIGNPFRATPLAPVWLTPNVLDSARRIHAERAFDRMPNLAVALEQAGCHDADILGHCRGTGPHVRGCWVVDLVLGKE